MQFKNEADWKKGLENNSDFYGSGIYRFAERWANMMEAELANGKKLAEVAQETSHAADTEGITGFMYGAAVSVLSHCWLHGEELRRWHNKDVQIGDEGDRANEKEGAVLNPAIINIG
jgi:hypothetical protein